jgi:hypothetical protein
MHIEPKSINVQSEGEWTLVRHCDANDTSDDGSVQELAGRSRHKCFRDYTHEPPSIKITETLTLRAVVSCNLRTSFTGRTIIQVCISNSNVDIMTQNVPYWMHDGVVDFQSELMGLQIHIETRTAGMPQSMLTKTNAMETFLNHFVVKIRR